MNDLISRSELLEEIKSLSIFLGGKQMFSNNAKDTILRIIDEQPTAYDADKVVEEIEAYGKNTDVCISKKNAIEIVKQGGVSDDISREAKQGKWVLDEFTAKYGNPYRCSCCNIEFGDTYNYCPNCGASMKEAK